MKCIFLQYKSTKPFCTVELPQLADENVWEIDDKTMNRYCKRDKFIHCPRLKAYMKYLKSKNK